MDHLPIAFPCCPSFYYSIISDHSSHTEQKREKKYICTVEGYLYQLMVLSRVPLGD